MSRKPKYVPPPPPKPPEICEGCKKEFPGNMIVNTHVDPNHNGLDAFKALCPQCWRRWKETH